MRFIYLETSKGFHRTCYTVHFQLNNAITFFISDINMPRNKTSVKRQKIDVENTEIAAALGAIVALLGQGGLVLLKIALLLIDALWTHFQESAIVRHGFGRAKRVDVERR